MSLKGVFGTISADLRENRGNYKGQIITLMYRVANYASDRNRVVRVMWLPYVLFYKVMTEFIFGIEIHWRAKIGPGLTIWHGYGLVVHSSSVIGARARLRHGVTIGNKEAHDSRAPIIGDDVEFGANAVVLGPITIGNNAKIGANCVVTKNVPPSATVIGNPARVIPATEM